MKLKRNSRLANVMSEPLDPRLLFAAAPVAIATPAAASGNPLTASFITFSSKPVIGGAKGHLLAKLTTDQAIHTTVPVTFVLSTDNAIDGEVATLGTVNRAINLRANGGALLPFNFTYPTTLANGNYFVVADVGPTAAGESDNITASSVAVNIIPPFVDLAALGFVGLKLTQKAGHNFNLTAQFENIGNITDKEDVTVQVYDATGGTFDPSTDTSYGSVHRKLVIPPNGKRNVPGFIALSAGQYYLAMQVSSTNDTNPNNNVFITPLLTVT